MHRYTSESNEASIEWRKHRQLALRKANTRISAGKILATSFWEWRGILLVEILDERCPVNAAYYGQLLDRVTLTYGQKRHTYLKFDSAP